MIKPVIAASMLFFAALTAFVNEGIGWFQVVIILASMGFLSWWAVGHVIREVAKEVTKQLNSSDKTGVK